MHDALVLDHALGAGHGRLHLDLFLGGHLGRLRRNACAARKGAIHVLGANVAFAGRAVCGGVGL